MDANHAHPTVSAHHETKRRVRKGTKSCWECKRRKMKCTLDPFSSSAVCNGCMRRGSKCVSQEFLENAEPSEPLAISGVAVDTGAPTKPRKVEGPITPSSLSAESLSPSIFQSGCPHPSGIYNLRQARTASPLQENHGTLSQYLYSSLPSREDLTNICNAHRHPSVPVLAHEILTLPYTTLHRDGLKTPDTLLQIPPPTSHPVLIAKHMLQVAIFLQHVHPRNEALQGLAESPWVIQERLASLAINLVTTNEELSGNIDGLACIMMESMYHVNVGNLRKGWMAGRRAIGIAQLMGLDRSRRHGQYKSFDSQTQYEPHFMWFRLLFLDHHLSLMLGLSLGSPDRSMAADMNLESDTLTGRLERMQCVIAARIVERNESSQIAGYLDPSQLELTETIDKNLQQAAASLPSKWWRAPNLDNVSSTSSEALFWDTRRLFAQVLHYNLLNQLHLPYMLCASSGAQQKRRHYSRVTCANASREIISRFNTLRGFNQIAYSWSCRIVDFVALMAAMTLLLTHLDGSVSSDSQDVLGHQYLTDRAAIEQVQEHMEEVNRLNEDVLSAQSANVLRRLLAIKVDRVENRSNFARRVTVHEPGDETLLEAATEAVVSAHIPYFGVFKIATEDAVQPTPIAIDTLKDTIQVENTFPGETSGGKETTASQRSPGPEISIWDLYNDILSEQTMGLPDMSATGNNWTFQGVDMNFLDSLAGDSFAVEENDGQ
ncbi:hypothetical protein F5B22DRAFT_624397 [Xylaria bambusicola]|uniref:uncharacterized protein n=1 Tax=Xylaria bambusicola TaxID=326684 RepID=UPI0020089C1F|nr:uncharacterized protein F5B22DRAFT_624397 [Xylaria bambusicola]KAI0506311.1 hypothetical protein F5B22DRAFT_624397 [Xylaria bambusicola]